jgi:hypothetical protein
MSQSNQPFSPFNRQNVAAPVAQQGPQTAPQGQTAAPAFVPRNPFTATLPPGYENINFGPGGKPDLPEGDHVVELIPGDAKKDPGAETGRWFYAPPGKSKDAKIAFALKIVESNDPTQVGLDFVRRIKLSVNSAGSDDIVFKKIAALLFSLMGIGMPTVTDKRNLAGVWEEYMAAGTMGGQSLVGLRCRVRVHPGKNTGPNGRPYLEYDFRPV